jgi:hypothetical protein
VSAGGQSAAGEFPTGRKSAWSCFKEPSHDMAVFRIALTEEEQQVVNAE